MRLAVRGKLFLSLVALITAGGLASGAYLEHELRATTEARIRDELMRHAEMARAWIEAEPSEDLDRISDQLGAIAHTRISVILRDGRVLGDSEVAGGSLAALDDHRTRPEVAKALAGEVGVAKRMSRTVHSDSLYVAVPLRRDGGVPGVVRASMPLTEVEHAAAALRVRLLIAGLIGFALSLVASALASHFFQETLRDLVERARVLALGGLRGDRLEAGSSINRLADELERTVSLLARERDRFEAVLSGLSEAVLALDAEDRIVLANPAARSLLELSDDPTGRTLLEITRRPELKDLAAQARAGKEGVSVEVELLGSRARRVLARGAAEKLGSGCVVVLVDVTEVRRLEAVRRDFVANVSHELRTPVSVIQASAETLLDGGLDDPSRRRGFVEALARNAERLSRLIGDLLDLSRIEAGRYPLELDALRLEGVALRAVEEVERRAVEKQLTVKVEVPPELRVRADARALEQVLVNLLDNAVKYTQAGGRVTVRGARSGDGQVRVEVEDDGPGIESRHRERIFERFYRVDPGRSREMGGTGLGLAIVRHLVEAMHGHAGVLPATPRGSIFWLTLPQEPDNPRAHSLPSVAA